MESGSAIFITVALAHALAVASPGPDFAMVVRQSIAHGRAAGVWTAAGIGSGILFHVAYGLFGLNWLTQRYPGLLQSVAVVGGGFLIWIGIQGLRARPATDDDMLLGSEPRPAARDFLVGLATNVLNPKATLFFVALFTVVIAGPVPTGAKVALGVWLPIATFAWFALVAGALTQAATRRRLGAIAHWIDRAMGAVLIGLGAAAITRAL